MRVQKIGCEVFGLYQPVVEAARTGHKLIPKTAYGITGIHFPWTAIKGGTYHNEKS